jgi:hypothetical protein
MDGATVVTGTGGRATVGRGGDTARGAAGATVAGVRTVGIGAAPVTPMDAGVATEGGVAATGVTGIGAGIGAAVAAGVTTGGETFSGAPDDGVPPLAVATGGNRGACPPAATVACAGPLPVPTIGGAIVAAGAAAAPAAAAVEVGEAAAAAAPPPPPPATKPDGAMNAGAGARGAGLSSQWLNVARMSIVPIKQASAAASHSATHRRCRLSDGVRSPAVLLASSMLVPAYTTETSMWRRPLFCACARESACPCLRRRVERQTIGNSPARAGGAPPRRPGPRAARRSIPLRRCCAGPSARGPPAAPSGRRPCTGLRAQVPCPRAAAGPAGLRPVSYEPGRRSWRRHGGRDARAPRRHPPAAATLGARASRPPYSPWERGRPARRTHPGSAGVPPAVLVAGGPGTHRRHIPVHDRLRQYTPRHLLVEHRDELIGAWNQLNPEHADGRPHPTFTARTRHRRRSVGTTSGHLSGQPLTDRAGRPEAISGSPRGSAGGDGMLLRGPRAEPEVYCAQWACAGSQVMIISRTSGHHSGR